MDGGWNEGNCSKALNCFLACHKLSPRLKYKEEKNKDGSFRCCLKIFARPLKSVISGWGSARRKVQAKKACKADVVRKLFHADLLPKYDGNCENLIRWIVASYRKYKAQEDLLVNERKLLSKNDENKSKHADMPIGTALGMIFKQFFGQNPISRLWVEVRDGLSNMQTLFYYNANDVTETCQPRPNTPNDFVISHVELSSMFDAFFGCPSKHRLFIAGPLECVEFCEVKKFFELEANRLEPPAENRRHHFRFKNPAPNIGGLRMLESDVVDVLNNFRHRQFIFVLFDRSSATRLVDNFDRKRVLMFDNTNSENADRRHIKFPLVCSAIRKKTTLPMINALITKLQHFIEFHQSNHSTKNAENGIENGALSDLDHFYAREEDANGNERGNSSSLSEEQATQIKQELSSNGEDSDIEFMGENAPNASNLRKIRNALMTVDANANLKVESDECYPHSPTPARGSSLLHQHDVTLSVATPKAATASQLQIKAEPNNDDGVLDMKMERSVQALTTSTPTRATYSNCSRAALSSVYYCDAEMVMTFIRQRIHEIPRTDQNRHKRKALRSISTEVSEFLHCWLEDDEERIDSDVMADELRSELNAFFLQQTDSKLRIYVSTMALVEQLCMGFITQRRSLRAVEPQPQLSNSVANKQRNKRRDDNADEQPKIALKRVKREVVQID